MCELECQLECESGSCERCQRLHLSKPEMRAPSATRAPPRSQPRRRHARATRTHASRWLMCAASVVRWADTCGRTLSRKRLGGLLLVLTLLLTMGLAPRAEALQMPSNDYQLTVNDTSTQERKGEIQFQSRPLFRRFLSNTCLKTPFSFIFFVKLFLSFVEKGNLDENKRTTSDLRSQIPLAF